MPSEDRKNNLYVALATVSSLLVGGMVGALISKSIYQKEGASGAGSASGPSWGTHSVGKPADATTSFASVRTPRPRSQGTDKPGIARFYDQVVIVTGGSSGIGQACALRFAREGAFVYIFDLFEASETLELINNNKSFTPRNRAISMKLDVTSPDQVAAQIDQIVAERGYIDAVVQCAGITGVTGQKAHLIEAQDFEKVWRVNMFGIFNVCKAVLPVMLKENYGRIVNVASISGKEGNPGQISYASSKGAVIAATKTLGKDYAQTGITINSIAPAVIQTKMVDAMPKQQVDMMKSKIPMKRTGDLNEIAATIAFMCSEENSFSTGFCFDLTGGRATY